MNRNTPKPVKNIPKRAKIKQREISLAKLIPVPQKEKDNWIEGVVKYLPFLLLQRGNSSIKTLLKAIPLPAPIPFLLGWLAKGLSYAANRYSVEQK